MTEENKNMKRVLVTLNLEMENSALREMNEIQPDAEKLIS